MQQINIQTISLLLDKDAERYWNSAALEPLQMTSFFHLTACWWISGRDLCQSNFPHWSSSNNEPTFKVVSNMHKSEQFWYLDFYKHSVSRSIDCPLLVAWCLENQGSVGGFGPLGLCVRPLLNLTRHVCCSSVTADYFTWGDRIILVAFICCHLKALSKWWLGCSWEHIFTTRRKLKTLLNRMHYWWPNLKAFLLPSCPATYQIFNNFIISLFSGQA